MNKKWKSINRQKLEIAEARKLLHSEDLVSSRNHRHQTADMTYIPPAPKHPVFRIVLPLEKMTEIVKQTANQWMTETLKATTQII